MSSTLRLIPWSISGWRVFIGLKTTMQDPRVLHGCLAWRFCVRQRLARNRMDFFLTRKNRFLIRQNGLLIGENFIESGLVLQDCRLIVKEGLLVLKDGGLMAEDGFLVGNNF